MGGKPPRKAGIGPGLALSLTGGFDGFGRLEKLNGLETSGIESKYEVEREVGIGEGV